MADDTLGPTGKFPKGRINADDEGEISIAVAHIRGKVIIEFGGPVHWLGMNPNEAIGLAALLVKHANRAKKAN